MKKPPAARRLAPNLPAANRPAFVRSVRRYMEANYQGENLAAACLHFAATTLMFLERAGVYGCLQAGTASWPRHPDRDHEFGQFSYHWEVDMQVIGRHLMAGTLPEMHVWVGLPQDQMIVDLTTGYQMRQCIETARMEWLTASLPEYIWCSGRELPGRYVYEASKSATMLAYRLLAETLDHVRGLTLNL